MSEHKYSLLAKEICDAPIVKKKPSRLAKETPNVPVVKKKPGRPPSVKPSNVKAIVKMGIINAPLKSGNCVEFNYDNPLVIKKLFSFLNGMNSKQVALTFTKKQIIILALDHLHVSRIKFTIDAPTSISYYCRAPITVYVNIKNIARILNSVVASYRNVMFEIHDKSSRRKLSITMENTWGSTEVRELTLESSQSLMPACSFDTSAYPIHITIPSAYFKKLITDSTVLSDVITFEKIGKNPLKLKHTSNDKSINSEYILTKTDHINVESTTGDAIFSSSMHLSYIIPIAKPVLSTSLSIYVTSTSNTIFKCELSDGCRCVISTNTIQTNSSQK